MDGARQPGFIHPVDFALTDCLVLVLRTKAHKSFDTLSCLSGRMPALIGTPANAGYRRRIGGAGCGDTTPLESKRKQAHGRLMAYLPASAIDEFQAIWQQRYGVELSREAAVARAHQVFALVRLLVEATDSPADTCSSSPDTQPADVQPPLAQATAPDHQESAPFGHQRLQQ